jgi:HlyD family secretion protein
MDTRDATPHARTDPAAASPLRIPSKRGVTRSQPRGSRRRRWFFAGGLLLVIIGAVAALQLRSPGSPTANRYVVYQVRHETLPIEVSERGNLESAHNVEHFCEVEGKSGGRSGGTAILWIIRPGLEVKKGGLLVQLESSYLEDMEKSQRITFNNALAAVARARADVSTAQKAIKEYEEGSFVQQLKTLQADVTVAEESLRRAQNNLRYTEKLYLNGFVNKLDVEAAEFAVRNAQLTLDKAKTALSILVQITKEKTLTQLRGDLEAKEAILKSEEERLSQEKARHDSMLTQLTKCKIHAKADGMVVYYEAPGRFGPDEEDKIREGAVVRERQKLIILPDLTRMQVRVLVNESKVGLVRKGQRAYVRVDALGDRMLAGQVEIIGAAPEQGPWYDKEKRNYPVILTLDESPSGLKPGMTAQATILIARLEQALTVPVQCVRGLGAESLCYVLLPNGNIEERHVRLGPNNDRFVQVVEGLAAGERVIESPEAALSLHKEMQPPQEAGPKLEAPPLLPTPNAEPPAPVKNREDGQGPPPGSKGKGIEENDGGPPPWSEKGQKMGKPFQPPPKK